MATRCGGGVGRTVDHDPTSSGDVVADVWPARRLGPLERTPVDRSGGHHGGHGTRDDLCTQNAVPADDAVGPPAQFDAAAWPGKDL